MLITRIYSATFAATVAATASLIGCRNDFISTFVVVVARICISIANTAALLSAATLKFGFSTYSIR